MSPPYYLDHHASSRVSPAALEAFLEVERLGPGNPHVETHSFGMARAAILQRAKRVIADSTGFEPEDVVFTSGATEANTLGILGLQDFLLSGIRAEIVHTAIEHKCVLVSVERLSRLGIRCHSIPVDRQGYAVSSTLPLHLDRVGLISGMLANNEIGTVLPLPLGYCAHAKAAGVLVHTDAAQAIGRIPVRPVLSNFDLVSLSGHKFGGLPGVGALLANRTARRRLRPVLSGGSQQSGLRPGTVPVSLCWSLAVALEEAERQAVSTQSILRKRCAHLVEALAARDVRFFLNGPSLGERLPGNLNLTFIDVESLALADALRNELAFSLGAACTPRQTQRSHVLKAIGLTDEEVDCTVRLGLGPDLTAEDIDEISMILANAVTQLVSLREA